MSRFYFVRIHNLDTGTNDTIAVEADDEDEARSEAQARVDRWSRIHIKDAVIDKELEDDIVELKEPWGWTNIDIEILGFQKTAAVLQELLEEEMFYQKPAGIEKVTYDLFGNPIAQDPSEFDTFDSYNDISTRTEEDEVEEGGFRLF